MVFCLISATCSSSWHHLEQSLKDMETTRDRQIRIATEGLRLVLECKMPQFCPFDGSDRLVQQQQEWSKRLPSTVPLLLDWIEQHRSPLFDRKRGPPAVQEFQHRFVLVFLELVSDFIKLPRANWCYWFDRLYEFRDDVERILTTNAAIRSWLFHYYGSELGLQGWQCRPGDLHSICQLLRFLDMKCRELDVLFGQKMIWFLEKIGKELMGFQQHKNYQKIGIKVMYIVMEINHEKQNYTNDAEEILRMALRLYQDDEVEDGCGEWELWRIVYYSVLSIHNVETANYSSLDEVMVSLLAHLNQELVKKAEHPNHSLGNGQLAYLRAVTLLLLLDVPKVDVKNCYFDELTISGRLCRQDELFRQHVQSHVRSTDNLRISSNLRFRIAKMIPKLFTGFTTVYYANCHAYRCLELLTWMTMFPAAQTRQQKNAHGLMLKRLLEEMKLLCEDFLQNPVKYSYDSDDCSILYGSLHPLLSVVQEGIKQLPNAGWFRRCKTDMQMRINSLLSSLELLQRYGEEREREEGNFFFNGDLMMVNR